VESQQFKPVAVPNEFKKSTDRCIELKAEGLKMLSDTLNSIRPTLDGSAPRVIQVGTEHAVAEPTTVLALARRLLGDKASDSQVDLYARQICKNLGLPRQPEKSSLEPGRKITLPGQTVEGGIVLAAFAGLKRVEFVDGTTYIYEGPNRGELRRTIDGKTTCVRWDSLIPERNSKFIIASGEKIEQQADGKTLVHRTADNGPHSIDGEPYFDQLSLIVEQNGRQASVVYTGDNFHPSHLVIVEPPAFDSGVQPFALPVIRDCPQLGKREYVDPTGKVGYILLGVELKRYTRSQDGEVITKRFDNGDIQKVDAAGRIISNRYRDIAGRTFEETYDPPSDGGLGKPSKVVCWRPGDSKPILFNRTATGRYEGKIDSADGKTQIIELQRQTLDIVTRNRKSNVITVEGERGTVTTYHNSPHAQAKVEVVTANGKLTTLRDRQGAVSQEQFITTDNFVFTRNWHHSGQVEAMSILEPDGSRTELHMNRDLGRFIGKRYGKDGKQEDAILNEDRLLLTDAKTTQHRAVEFDWWQSNNPRMKLISVDLDTGFTTKEGQDRGTTSKASFQPGRVDTLGIDGIVRGEVLGADQLLLEESWWNPKTKEALVTRIDGSGVRLKDGRIDSWNANSGQNSTLLTPREISFINSNRAIDLRLIAEIHQRLNGDRNKIDSLYKQLEAVNKAKSLSVLERQSLTTSLLHHIAHPAEISQGHTFCCNVTVVQRDLAINAPDHYARTIITAISDGTLKTTDGTTVHFDPANLKAPDTTGRDIASRIFQTLAIQVALHPNRFSNTTDGVGRITNESGNSKTFDGVSTEEITKLIYDLTAREQALAKVSSVEELAIVFRKNGSRPMIVIVDALKPPFSTIPSNLDGTHVVTVTGMECIDSHSVPPKYKVFVQDQGGPHRDHSMPQTAFNASELVQNMFWYYQGGNVMIDGDKSMVFVVADGVLKEDKAASEARQRLQERLRSEK
jgi:hypothetical protein